MLAGVLALVAELDHHRAMDQQRALADALLARKRKPGRPKKGDDARLLVMVEGLRAAYERRDGRPYSDRQAITEGVIEQRLMGRQGLTRERAESALTTDISEGVKLRAGIQTLVKAVQAERRRRSGE